MSAHCCTPDLDGTRATGASPTTRGGAYRTPTTALDRLDLDDQIRDRHGPGNRAVEGPQPRVPHPRATSLSSAYLASRGRPSLHVYDRDAMPRVYGTAARQRQGPGRRCPRAGAHRLAGLITRASLRLHVRWSTDLRAPGRHWQRPGPEPAAYAHVVYSRRYVSRASSLALALSKVAVADASVARVCW